MTSETVGMIPNASNTGLDLTINGLLGVPGGSPCFVNGVCMGAIGANGASSAQDV